MQSCPFCNGTGIIIFKNHVDKCSHCYQGNFIFTNNVRSELIGIKEKKFEKGLYEGIINELKNIEHNALSKIGDK
jgi:hypothetical protein